jgi:DNA-binding transcriptional LysR family regulator
MCDLRRDEGAKHGGAPTGRLGAQLGKGVAHLRLAERADAFRRSGLEPPRRSVTVGSAQCTSNLVAKGHFLGVHSSMFLRFTPPSVRLKVLPVELPIPQSSTSIVTLRNRTLSPVAQLFIDAAREITRPLADRE